jgi:resuscitation-promoting factor RpfB
MPTTCISRSGRPGASRRPPWQVPPSRRRSAPSRSGVNRLRGFRTLHFLATLLLAALGLGWLSTEKTVLLHVNGQLEQVATRADTVAELLDRAGVQADHTDRLVPGPQTVLADGMVVELIQSRRVTVLVGGQRRHLVVPALHAEDVLTALETRGAEDELVSPAPLTPVYDGMVVEVGVPVPVTVVADGRDRKVTAAEGVTVGALLDRLGIKVDRDDRVTPPLVKKVSKGTQVVVQRVVHTFEERQVSIPAPVLERFNAELPEGERREASAGQEGTLQVTERVTRVDGVPQTRVRVDERVIVEPEARIIEIGAGSAQQDEEGIASSGDDPDEAPTQSENVQTGGASWYVHGNELTAAHRSLPKGTIATVTNLENGKSVKVRINDRGPYIAGRIIDLNRVAFEEIASVSDGVIDVRITW